MDKEAVLGTIAGLIIGAAGAAIWCSKRFEKALELNDDAWDEYCTAILEAQKEHCQNCQQNFEEANEEDFDEADKHDAKALIDYLNTVASSDADIEDRIAEERDESGVVSYENFSKKKKEAEAETADDNTEEDERVQDEYLDEEEPDELVITFIEKSDYDDEYEDYEKIPLTYLEESDIFLTEDNEKYIAYPAIGGKENLEAAFEESSTGIVYIRNTALEIDFQITSDIRDYDTYIKETSDD